MYTKNQLSKRLVSSFNYDIETYANWTKVFVHPTFPNEDSIKVGLTTKRNVLKVSPIS